MKPMNRSKLICAVAMVLAAAHVHALPPQADGVLTRSETVRYNRAQVVTADGAARVYERLRAAAERVCADPATSGAGKLQPLADPGRSRCLRDALGQAVQQIGSPAVAQLHTGRAPAPAKVRRPVGEAANLARARR